MYIYIIVIYSPFVTILRIYLFILFFCIWIFCLYVCVWCMQSPEKGIGFPETTTKATSIQTPVPWPEERTFYMTSTSGPSY